MNIAGEPKHFVIVHGYLFEGSGSNVYSQNIALAWKEQGHKVTVLCQDRNAWKLPFVDDFIQGTPNAETKMLEFGKLRIVVPDIDNLLPVYVDNKYEGYNVKVIPEMTEEQIQNHIAKTAHCLKTVCELDKVDKVLTNHALLSPIIAYRALQGSNIPYDVKIHGSAVTYTLKPHMRLMKYALPGLKGAKNIYVGTNFVKSLVLEVFEGHHEEIKLKEKISILSPGMNEKLFNIQLSREQCEKEFLNKVAEKIKGNPTGRKDHSLEINPNPESLNQEFLKDQTSYNQRVLDADLLQRWVPLEKDDRLIIYIGAFIGTKGCGELLAMAPSLILQKPSLKFVFCGFGTYREHLSQLLNSFEEGDLEKARAICKAGDFVTDINIEDYFCKIDRRVKDRIIIAGFTEHQILSSIIPLCSICVVPSKINEAFGMVTVESMSGGALPILNNHSGLSDILDLIEQEFPELISIIRVEKKDFFKSLPVIIMELLKYLEIYPEGEAKLRARIRKIAVDHFSWSSICRRLAAN